QLSIYCILQRVLVCAVVHGTRGYEPDPDSECTTGERSREHVVVAHAAAITIQTSSIGRSSTVSDRCISVSQRSVAAEIQKGRRRCIAGTQRHRVRITSD